ncbi:MAG TPA: alanine dehydrogenase [Acidiferrobacter sp.]|nr:alanine dehydrogenase [Acidiferrobacter sp.]
MRIGVPREVKPWEARVALVPHAVAVLVQGGHELFLQAGAGLGSGFGDDEYAIHGARILADASALYRAAQLIVKVKEPVAAEYPLLRSEHILFSYLHLAANRPLAEALQKAGLTAVAFETIVHDGTLPLLAPMSDIAGRLAVQIGSTLVHAPAGGRGVLLGGLAGTERGQVVVVGAGVAGGNAVRLAAALGAQVVVFDKLPARLHAMAAVGANVTALPAYEETIAEAVRHADLVIGAVLVAGARAPRVIPRSMVATMRPGTVIMDIAIDQGGCVETMRPTDYGSPTFVAEGVVHFGVTNMPGAVPRTASQALSAVLLPYVEALAVSGPDDQQLSGGLNVQAGRIVHEAVAAALS